MQSVGNHAVEEQLLDIARDTEIESLYIEARAFANRLVSEDHDRSALIEVYEAVVNRLYDEERDEEAEELLEVMAELEGWCASNLAI